VGDGPLLKQDAGAQAKNYVRGDQSPQKPLRANRCSNQGVPSIPSWPMTPYNFLVRQGRSTPALGAQARGRRDQGPGWLESQTAHGILRPRGRGTKGTRKAGRIGLGPGPPLAGLESAYNDLLGQSPESTLADYGPGRSSAMAHSGSAGSPATRVADQQGLVLNGAFWGGPPPVLAMGPRASACSTLHPERKVPSSPPPSPPCFPAMA